MQVGIRGVTRGWAGVLVPTLGFYKNKGLRADKKLKASKVNSLIAIHKKVKENIFLKDQNS